MRLNILLVSIALALSSAQSQSATLARDYTNTLREPGGALKHPFFTPGSEQYIDVLWDWDSWTSNWSLRQIALEHPAPATVLDRIRPYERGCILNFLDCPSASSGYLPICIERGEFNN